MLEIKKCSICNDTNQINNDFLHHIKTNGEIICEKCCYYLYLKDIVSPNYFAYDDFFDSANGCFDMPKKIDDEMWNDNNTKIFFKVKTHCNANVKFIIDKNYENYENLLLSIINKNNDIYQEELKKFSNIFQIFNKKCHWLAYDFHTNIKNKDKLSFEIFNKQQNYLVQW